MKSSYKNKIIRFSVATALIIGTSAYAGKIISNATYINNNVTSENAIVSDSTQFGSGGWNLDNINVKIVSTDDYSTALPGYTFDVVTGVYTSMGTGQSFESEILSGGEVRGKLHGKDWPVGEPSGIKIINGDLKALATGSPANCIMTSSYLKSHYLDELLEERWPSICSSSFQTHKRFKVNMLPTTVDTVDAEGYGKPFDIVFNLDLSDINTSITTYQVLQKINNYTGKILDGYKLEILDGSGAKNDNLTLSLDKDSIDDYANFSYGLWGPVNEPHFPTQGFFDSAKAYYPVTLSDDNQTISWHGDLMGGNYQAVFRNRWLYSTIAPKGIFFDDDNNPATDAQLMAFWGVPPTLPDTTPQGWYKGQVQLWVPVTPEELDAWQVDALDSLYSEGTIEDVLNLGITYNVNIGDNAQIGEKFIIRITPHIDTTVYNPAVMPAIYYLLF